jgi:hypothetical protein
VGGLEVVGKFAHEATIHRAAAAQIGLDIY